MSNKIVIETSNKDDFLYIELINFLKQVKLVRGGTELAYSLRNHPILRDYLKSKQIVKFTTFESKYFNGDGTLNQSVIDDCFLSHSRSLQKF